MIAAILDPAPVFMSTLKNTNLQLTKKQRLFKRAFAHSKYKSLLTVMLFNYSPG